MSRIIYENTGSWIHYWDQNGMLDADGNHTIYHAPISKEDFISDFEDILVPTGDGFIAQTIEEAAEYIGCDVETLKATVESYNGYKAGQYHEADDIQRCGIQRSEENYAEVEVSPRDGRYYSVAELGCDDCPVLPVGKAWAPTAGYRSNAEDVPSPNLVQSVR